MNTPIDTLIAGEQAKIELLRAKIKECERRIETLSAMQSDDDIDAVLTRRLQRPVVAPVVNVTAEPGAGTVHSATYKMKAAALPKKALNEATLKLLRFAEGEEKSIDDFLAYASQAGINKDRPGLRAFLHQYKATYGLLDSDRAGYFRLSHAGSDYLKLVKPNQGVATSAA